VQQARLAETFITCSLTSRPQLAGVPLPEMGRAYVRPNFQVNEFNSRQSEFGFRRGDIESISTAASLRPAASPARCP